jgi:hypothetical protein
MSASLKPKPAVTPTPYSSPQRAALAHAIAAAADAAARRVALERVSQAANSDVLKAIGAVEAAETTLAEAQANTAKHMVDKALGTAGVPPLTVREARAAVIAAQDHLDECRQTRAALNLELDKSDNSWSSSRVADAAYQVIMAEARQRAVALAAEVAALQQKLVARGSALEWLHRNGAFPKIERGETDHVGGIVQRMESAPSRWTMPTQPGVAPFAQPVGANAWAEAFEALKRDAAAQLPLED